MSTLQNSKPSLTSKQRQPLSLSRRKRLVFSMITGALVVITIGLAAEALTRLKGIEALKLAANFISISPPGRYFIKHPTRGYAYEPGEFTITLGTAGYSFRVSHQEDGLRRTHPAYEKTPPNKKGIWIFGCSFTHGFSLNDEETYPWLLQRDLPDYEVVNFGVDGYSNVQSLIQFKEAIKSRNKPAIVVVAYASFDDTRNRATRLWKKLLLTNSRLGPMNFPYATLGPDKQLVLLNDQLEYPGFALLRLSALANYLDNRYNTSIEGSYHSHEVSRAVLKEFSNLCKANGIQFVVAGILNDPLTADMLAALNAEGVMTVDISVDLVLKENVNLPHDPHPSAIANQQFASKLETFLSTKLIDKTRGQTRVIPSPAGNAR